MNDMSLNMASKYKNIYKYIQQSHLPRNAVTIHLNSVNMQARKENCLIFWETFHKETLSALSLHETS